MNKKAIEKINNVLPRKINILDIGSRGGLSGWLKEIEKSCEVYPFDADPQLSKENYSGLSDVISYKKFYKCEDLSQSSFFQPNPAIKDFENEEIRLKYEIIEDVKTVTVDSLNLEKNIDVIKIDTQGSEFEILMGSIELLKKDMPLLFLETWTYPIYKNIKTTFLIVNELEKIGYELWGIDEAASFRLNISDLVTKNYSRRRLAGLNIFMAPKINYIKSNLQIDKIKIYSFLLFLHGYTDWSYRLIEDINEDKFKIELIKFIKQQNRFAKLNYLIHIIKDFYKKISGKGPSHRFKKFT